MKSYTIGREETCNIVIPDSSQMVSRLHATLTLDGSKMTITDSSSNGTYINGIRIASGTPVPVTRKDVISFAQAAELDWKLIPNPGKRTLWIILAVIAVLAGGGCGCWYYLQSQKEKQEQAAEQERDAQQALAAQVDTLASQVGKANKALEGLKSSLTATKEECARKPEKELTKVKQLLAQAEEKINSLDTEALQKSLDSLKQSQEDGSDKTAQRADDLTAQISTFNASLDEARSVLDEARNTLSGIPDKAGVKPRPAAPVAEPAPEPEPENKQDTRVF